MKNVESFAGEIGSINFANQLGMIALMSEKNANILTNAQIKFKF